MDIFKKLQYQSALSYLVIAGLLIAIFTTLWILIDRQEKMAHIINITGKQRMLSQRIVMLSQSLQMSGRSELSEKLEHTIREMRLNHTYIKSIPSAQIQTVLYGMRYEYDKHLIRYLAEAEHFRLHRDRRSLSYLFFLSDHMLSTADAMVFISENEYQQMISTYKTLLAVLSLLFSAVLFFVYRNITLRSLKDASEIFSDLKLSEEKIRGLSDHTTSLISIKDMEGRYRFVNPSFVSMAGVESSRILGKSDAELFGPDMIKILTRHDDTVRQSGKAALYSDTLMTDAGMQYYSTDKFLIMNNDGSPYGICSISTDTTEQARTHAELVEAQKLLTQAQIAAGIGTWTIDPQTRELHLSDYAADFLNLELSNDFLMLDDLIVKMCDQDIDRIMGLFENALDYGIGFSDEFHIQQENGVHVYQIVTETELAEGTISKLYGTIQDITKTAIDNEKMLNYLQLVDENIITSKTNKYGIITYVSQSFSTISGYSKEELIGSTHRIVRHPDMPAELFESLWNTISRGETWQGEIKNRTKRGESYWVRATISPNFDYKGNIIGYTAIRQDITDKKKIEQISITDPLTGLYNRHYFNEIGRKELNRTLREGNLFGFVVLDIDNFKKYNDAYGHHEGDNVLVRVATALKESFQRANDSVFRLGGEEFGIFISGKDIRSLRESVERSRIAIERLEIEHMENIPHKRLTASFGMVTLNTFSPQEVKSIEALYKAADQELYRAKNNGRNQLCVQSF